MNILRKLIQKYMSVMVCAIQIDRKPLFLFFDIIYCQLRFGCTQQEYLKYHFYNYKNSYRKNFILDCHITLYQAFLDSSSCPHSKYEKYLCFKSETSREIILLPNCGEAEFLEFAKKHKKMVLKPNNGRAGRGIQIIDYADDNTALEIFHSVGKDMLCEEFVCQHKDIARLNPSSVNTIRVVTIHNGNMTEIVSAALKIGRNADSSVDNMHAGGIACGVDIDTGIIFTCGIDYAGNSYYEHPVSQCQLVGFRIPLWEEAKHHVLEIHKRFPDTPVIGWDIAIKESSIEIIEANAIPGPNLMQLTDQKPKGKKIFQLAKEQKIKIR